ncbi:MAG: hypothetical protein K0Q95_735 [Bacteroidota bacterium]|jgi:hypothetical protein|nr:hypothetical protein [Bacteroidota bacterium]
MQAVSVPRLSGGARGGVTGCGCVEWNADFYDFYVGRYDELRSNMINYDLILLWLAGISVLNKKR